MDKELKRFLQNVYRYLLIREHNVEFAVIHMRHWGLTKEQWEQMWEGNEEEKPEISEELFK